jgi:leucyl/phenylalanyl-tRNA--protein transferase
MPEDNRDALSTAGTWITPDMIRAYCRLHDLGHAHSVELWIGDELVGGVYGIAIGRMFFGESMFSHVTDASKIALVALCRQLHRWSFSLMDCQVANPHLFSMGAIEMNRDDFEAMLIQDTRATPGNISPENWTACFAADKRW